MPLFIYYETCYNWEIKSKAQSETWARPLSPRYTTPKVAQNVRFVNQRICKHPDEQINTSAGRSKKPFPVSHTTTYQTYVLSPSSLLIVCKRPEENKTKRGKSLRREREIPILDGTFTQGIMFRSGLDARSLFIHPPSLKAFPPHPRDTGHPPYQYVVSYDQTTIGVRLVQRTSESMVCALVGVLFGKAKRRRRKR